MQTSSGGHGERTAGLAKRLAIAMGVGACLSAALVVGGCAAAGKGGSAGERDVTLLQQQLTGSFTSTEQAREDPENYLDIHLHMTPIWAERTDGKWMYVEQAAAARLDRPYRQRVYRLTANADGTVTSAVYTLPGDALAYAGAWKDVGKLKGLTPEQLTLREGCALVLRREGETFIGATQGTGCASDLRGAAYATSRAHIAPEMLETWDQGFDAQGKQVWGAEKGPYQFRRQH